jgi:hypothetical protein
MDDDSRMCFNGPKTWQLGWYANYHLDLGTKSNIDTTVDLIGFAEKEFAVKSVSSDVYIHFNRRIGFNINTMMGGDQVLVATQNPIPEYSPSDLKAQLASSQVYSFANFDGSPNSLVISVISITTNTVPARARVRIQFLAKVQFETGIFPSPIPTSTPTRIPSLFPTKIPTLMPSLNPTDTPTTSPTGYPTSNPTLQPTLSPTFNPSQMPFTVAATLMPSVFPSKSPTPQPSAFPSKSPTLIPKAIASKFPTHVPSIPSTKVEPILVTKSPPPLRSPSKKPNRQSKPTTFLTQNRTKNPTTGSNTKKRSPPSNLRKNA